MTAKAIPIAAAAASWGAPSAEGTPIMNAAPPSIEPMITSTHRNFFIVFSLYLCAYEINGDFCKLCEQRLGSLNDVENTL